MGLSATGEHRPYIFKEGAALVAPTLASLAPATAAASAQSVTVTLTGTFTDCNNMLLVDGQAENYCTYTNATTLTAVIRLNNTTAPGMGRIPGAHLVEVVDCQGQRVPVARTFTIT